MLKLGDKVKVKDKNVFGTITDITDYPNGLNIYRVTLNPRVTINIEEELELISVEKETESNNR